MENKQTLHRESKAALKKKELKVFTPSRVKYSFKQIDRKEWEVMSVISMLDYVFRNGFKDMLLIKKLEGNRQYIKRGEEIYVLISQPQGEKLKLRNEENGLIFTELIAKFHNAAEGFIQPPGIKIRVDWGKRMEKYRMASSRLDKYINYLEGRESLNEFEEYTKGYTDMLLKRARASMKILKSLGYLRALEGSMKRKEICINDISSNTAVYAEGRALIGKPFKAGYNMVEEDLAALIKKLIIETGDISVFDRIIGRYSEIRELGEDSENIIRALASYPFDSIKIISRYYNHAKGSLEEDYLYNTRMLEKFKKYISRELLTNVLEV